MKTIKIISLLWMPLGLALPASATILYDNFSNASNSDDQVRNFGSSDPNSNQNQSFSTDGNLDTLTSVTLGLFASGNTTGSIAVDLYSFDPSNGGHPGTFLDQVGTIQDSSIGLSGMQHVLVTAPANVSLTANTQYFIVLFGTTTGTNDAFWTIANNDSGTGTVGQRGGQGESTPQVMQVVATASSATPEPSTFAMLLLPLAWLGMRRARAGFKGR
jgi:hypothetical protein